MLLQVPTAESLSDVFIGVYNLHAQLRTMVELTYHAVSLKWLVVGVTQSCKTNHHSLVWRDCKCLPPLQYFPDHANKLSTAWFLLRVSCSRAFHLASCSPKWQLAWQLVLAGRGYPRERRIIKSTLSNNPSQNKEARSIPLAEMSLDLGNHRRKITSRQLQ